MPLSPVMRTQRLKERQKRMSEHTLRRSLMGSLALVLVVLAGAGWALQEKGSVSGQVLNADGKPLVGLNLRLERTDPATHEGPGGRSVIGGQSGASELQSPGGQQKGIKIVGRATTDREGKFLIKDITPGMATLVGGGRNIGWIYYEVEIIAGQEQKLGEIKLIKP
jgi:hypothetical protein